MTTAVRLAGSGAAANAADWLRGEILDAAAAAGPRLGPVAHALVLTGSVARGEATVSRTRSGWRVHGDAEFLVIIPEGVRATPAATEVARAAVARALAARAINCPVSLHLASRSYLRRMRPHIFGCELQVHGRVAWGQPDVLNAIPHLALSAIPPEDGWHLLSNRIVEFLEAAAANASGAPDAPDLAYTAVKLGVDLGASLLVAAGAFQPSYRSRQRALAAWVRQAAPVTSAIPLAEIVAAVSVCTDWKLEASAWPPPGSARVVAWLVPLAYQLWAWELHRLAGGSPIAATTALADWRTNWRCHAARQGLSVRLRGWLHLWRARRAWSTPQLWGHWAPMARVASPRLWVYRAAAELLSAGPAWPAPSTRPDHDSFQPWRWDGDARHACASPGGPSRSAAHVAQGAAPCRAAVAGRSAAIPERLCRLPDPALLRSVPGAGWESQAAAIAAHYHAYLEDTRS
ncbi:MAG: hypothetical protein ACRD2E_01095 [Terriglobales bacterium]